MTHLTEIKNTSRNSTTTVCFYFTLLTDVLAIAFLAKALAKQAGIDHVDVEDDQPGHCINFLVECLDADQQAYMNLENLHATLIQLPEDPKPPYHKLYQPAAKVNGWLDLVQKHSSTAGIVELENVLLHILQIPDGFVLYEHEHHAAPAHHSEFPIYREMYQQELQASRRQTELKL